MILLMADNKNTDNCVAMELLKYNVTLAQGFSSSHGYNVKCAWSKLTSLH